MQVTGKPPPAYIWRLFPAPRGAGSGPDPECWSGLSEDSARVCRQLAIALRQRQMVRKVAARPRWVAYSEDNYALPHSQPVPDRSGYFTHLLVRLTAC